MANRLHYVDWLRVLAFMTLILFHCAVPFVADYHWEINNDTTSPWITRIVHWTHQWRLPLLFFISGVGVRFSLRRRTIPKFFGERVVRLFIPLVFAMFFITPIQVYFEWLEAGKISMSYASFYPQVFEMVPYPKGSLTWSHMWFVAYLFVFTILLLPLFSLSKVKWFNKFKKSLNALFANLTSLLTIGILFVFYIFWLYIDWPEQGSLLGDWYVFNTSISFYVLGFLLSGIDSFWESCQKYRRVFLIVALVLATTLIVKYYWNWTAYEPTEQDSHLYLYGFLNGFHIWSILLCCIGYAKHYLDRPNKHLMYLNTAVYPFFILHQTVIVASGYFVLQWKIPIVLKLLLLIVICMVTIWVLYHFVIRRTILTRVLFGMKWKRKA